MTIILDATDLILGRLASETAKIILGKQTTIVGKNTEGKTVTVTGESGDNVIIINADKAVITGNPKVTTKRYVSRMHKKTLTNPRRGPFFPRQPEEIVRRAVRGMIPWKKSSGKYAYKKLTVYVGVPSDKLRSNAITLSHTSVEKTISLRITVGELARRISTYDQRIEHVKH